MMPGHESDLAPQPEWQPRCPGSGRLAGKVALVTGADSGIGRAVAALFAREGADIVIACCASMTTQKKTAGDCPERGSQCDHRRSESGREVGMTTCPCDRRSMLSGSSTFSSTTPGEQHPDKDIRDISEVQLRRTFQTNIFAMFFSMTQAALPHLGKASAIINCTSVTMYRGSGTITIYV